MNFSGPDEILFASIDEGIEDLVEFAIKIGANTNSSNHHRIHDRSPPLMFATLKGHRRIIQKLLDMDANINIQGNYGNTALMYAAKLGDAEVIDVLLENKDTINVNIKNNDGHTALMLAILYEHDDVLKQLLYTKEKDHNINLQDNFGYTVLMVAAQYDNKHVVEILLDMGANVTLQNNNGYTALMLACKNNYGHEEVVQKLLDKDPNVINFQDKDGSTALMHAVQHSHIDMVEILLDNDADVALQNNDGCTSLLLAMRIGNSEVKDLFRRKKYNLRKRKKAM